MNFGLSFGYIFQDQDWFKKLLLPALCMLIPIVGWMVALGWALKAARNVMDGREAPLPDLDFGNDILRGFFAFLIGFVYSLPVSIINKMGGWVRNWGYRGNEVAMVGTGLVTAVLALIAFLLGVVATFISVAAIAHYVAKDDLGAAFRLNEVFDILKANLGDWVIVVLGTILAVGIIGPLGTIACIIGVVLTLTYGLAVMGHLIGQAYAKAQPQTMIVSPEPEIIEAN